MYLWNYLPLQTCMQSSNIEFGLLNRTIWLSLKFCVFCCTEGLLQDCRLPPKKLIGTNNQEFTESKREQFETYLQVTKSDIIVKCIAATSHQICIDLTVLAWSICNLLGLDYHVIMIKFVRQNRKFCVIMIIKDERKCQLPAECPQTTWRCLSGFFGALQVLHYHFIVWFSECTPFCLHFAGLTVMRTSISRALLVLPKSWID